MNIDKGCKLMIKLANENIIQIPSKLTILTNTQVKPVLFEEAQKGVSIYVGIEQDFMSGSILKSIYNYNNQPSILSKHSIQTINEFNQIETEMTQIIKQSFLNKKLKKIAYQSWTNDQVDFTYFVQVDEKELHLTVDFRNPNGWAENFRPKYILNITKEQTQEFGKRIIDEKTLEEIIKQSTIIFKRSQLPNIIIEGKIMNKNYQQKGICIIDLYDGYTNKTPTSQRLLTHNEHLKTYKN